MKKIFSFSFIIISVLILTGCNKDEVNSKEVINPDDYYCVSAYGPIEYCFKDKETFENIYVMQENSFELTVDVSFDLEEDYTKVPLEDLIISKQDPLLYMIDDSYVYQREYETIYRGTHTFKASNIGSETEQKTFEIEIVEFEEQYSKNNGLSQSVIFENEICQMTDENYNRYGVKVDGEVYSFEAAIMIQDISINDLDLEGFHCGFETMIIDSVSYDITFLSQEFKVLTRYITNEGFHGYIDYVQKNSSMCHQWGEQYFESFLLVDNELVDIQTALDQSLIDIEDLWRYGLQECNITFTYIPFLLDDEAMKYDEHFEIYTNLDDYTVYFNKDAMALYQEYPDFVTMSYQDYIISINEAQLEGVYLIEVDGDLITVSEALEQELITLETMIEKRFIHMLIYGYYE